MEDKLEFYFAFASNVSKRKILSRVSKFESREAATLKNYCLKFNVDWKNDGHGYANIEPKEGSTVYGALYTMSPTSLKQNDEEHVKGGGHFRRIIVQVVKNSGQEVDAFTYIANDEFTKEGSKPSREYLETILDGSDVLPDTHTQTLQEMLEQCDS